MAVDITTAYSITHQATKLERAAFARTLTNNPAPGVAATLDAEVGATVALLGGTVVPATSAVIASGVAITKPVTGTYVNKITPTIVDGVITGFVLG